MVDFYLNDPVATTTIPGHVPAGIGSDPWVVGTIAFGIAALRFATRATAGCSRRSSSSAALPRILLVNLALLLAAPLPRREVAGSPDDPGQAPSTTAG